MCGESLWFSYIGQEYNVEWKVLAAMAPQILTLSKHSLWNGDIKLEIIAYTSVCQNLNLGTCS